jgi:hypothetical protein
VHYRLIDYFLPLNTQWYWHRAVRGSPVCAAQRLSKRFLFTAPPIRAPGYELHRGVGYYKIHSERKTWYEARQICAQEGGHLAIINSEEEFKVLQSMLAPVAAKVNEVWAFIGFHDLFNEGQYLTIFGKESLSKIIEHMHYNLV